MRRTLALATLAAAFAFSSTAHAGLLDRPLKAVFKRIAEKRQDRVFHAQGVAYRATIKTADGKEQPAIVRVSRGGAGKPGHADILGVAIKTAGKDGVDQDFLLVTAKSDRGIGARLAKFSDTLAGQSISSLTSFRIGGQKGAITARLPATFKTPIDSIDPGVGEARQSFQLNLRRSGLFRAPVEVPTAEVTVHFDQPLAAEQAKALRFTPFHDGNGVEPVGLINRLRKPAYLGSEAGRGDAGP